MCVSTVEDVFVYMFTEVEIPPCESVLIIKLKMLKDTFWSMELIKSCGFIIFKIIISSYLNLSEGPTTTTTATTKTTTTTTSTTATFTTTTG